MRCSSWHGFGLGRLKCACTYLYVGNERSINGIGWNSLGKYGVFKGKDKIFKIVRGNWEKVKMDKVKCMKVREMF